MDNTFKVMRNIQLANDFLVRKDALNVIPFPLIFRSLEKPQAIWCNEAAKRLGFTEQRVHTALAPGNPGRDPFFIRWETETFFMESALVTNLEGHLAGQIFWPIESGLASGSELLQTGLAFARGGRWTYINRVARRVLGLLEAGVPQKWATVDWLPDWNQVTAKGSGTLLVTQHDGYEIRLHGDGQWVVLEAIPESLVAGEHLATDVVAALMHEIRNPLATLSGRIELAEMQAKDPDLQALLATAMTELERLAKLTDDVLWATRDTNIEPTDLEIEPLIRECWQDTERMIPAPRVQLKIDAPIRLHVLADPNRLRHIFLNLFKNAREAMQSQGTEVRVRITSGPERTAVDVVDDGPGIAEPVMRILFQVHKSTKPTGSGLGLTIVRRLVESHGGTLTVQSTPGNTRISFDLPNPAAPGAPPP